MKKRRVDIKRKEIRNVKDGGKGWTPELPLCAYATLATLYTLLE